MIQSSKLIKSWIEIYGAVLDADNEEIKRRVKRHIKLCVDDSNSEERINRLTKKAMSLPTSHLKDLIFTCMNGLTISQKNEREKTKKRPGRKSGAYYAKLDFKACA